MFDVILGSIYCIFNILISKVSNPISMRILENNEQELNVWKLNKTINKILCLFFN